MIGNPISWGNKGWVILEEGRLDPRTLQLMVTHYLVVMPSGEAVSGTFTLPDAKDFITEEERKASRK